MSQLMMAIGNSFGATMAKPDDTPETVIHRKDELMNTNKISRHYIHTDFRNVPLPGHHRH